MGATFDPLLGRLRTTDAGGSGSGDVTHTGTLTAHEVILGNGGADIKALGAVGSLGDVLTSGGAGVDPSWQPATGGGTIDGTIASTQVAFGTGADTIGGDAGLTYDSATNALTPLVLYAGGIIDDTTSGPVQLNGTVTVPLSAPFQSGVGIKGDVTTSEDTSATLEGIYLDVFLDAQHNATNGTGQDMTNNVTVASGKTLGWYVGEYLFTQYNGPGTVPFATQVQTTLDADATQLGAVVHLHAFAPFLSSGATIGSFTYLQLDDISGITVGSTKQVINYGAGKFVVDSDGSITTPNVTLSGSALRTDTTNAHIATLQAYDVDNTTYRTFATLTNGNTPSFVITPPAGGTVTLNATTLQQGGSTITLGGAFTMSGAFAFTGTITNTTSVTFPTSGTLLTTAGSGTSLTFPGTLSIASGKVLTASSTFNLTGTDGKGIDVGAATSGKFLIGDGTNLVLSTSTIPTSAGATANKVLLSDGTNYILSTPTFPNASATSGKFIRSDGTNWIASTPTLPTSAGTSGKILASDGTNYVESSSTFATAAGATGGILESDGTNWVRRSRVIALSGAASSAHTGNTNETNLAVATITGGIMGANSCLFITSIWKMTGTNAAKTRTVRVSTSSGDTSGGTLYLAVPGAAGNLSALHMCVVMNANNTSAQVGYAADTSAYGGSNTTSASSSINTGTDFYINFNAKLTNGSDSQQLIGYCIELVTP